MKLPPTYIVQNGVKIGFFQSLEDARDALKMTEVTGFIMTDEQWRNMENAI